MTKKKILQRYILLKIESGDFRGGDKLPSENQLSIKFEISRTIVRIVLLELCASGILYPLKSKGYYVTSSANSVFYYDQQEKLYETKITTSDKHIRDILSADEFKEFSAASDVSYVDRKAMIGSVFTYTKNGKKAKVKISFINKIILNNIDISLFEEKTFMEVVAYQGTVVKSISRTVIYSRCNFLDKIASEMGYKGEMYPIILTSSFSEEGLIDFSINIIHRDDFIISSNQTIFFSE